ncbi:MAG: DNA primase [Chitinophagaceae bacterium]|nr:DNA primase [Chitinophagaceae bacterium]
MNVRENKLSCEQAKQMDMVDYLCSLGYTADRIRKDDHWYRSPLRKERTASFKVNRKKNLWYDHGTGQGGTLIDFGILYYNCSVNELLDRLNGHLSFHPQNQGLPASEPEESAILIHSEKAISSLSLLRYLKQRRIAESVAKKYCREVHFSGNRKMYTAISFKNGHGGFELRNPWYKGCVAPKAVTIINNGSQELAVFEGFFDFLSHQTIHKGQPSSHLNFLILNSTSFFEKSRTLMEQHERIYLFLDRDKTGQNCTRSALTWSQCYRDESGLYAGYKDLNEWMQNIGKSQKTGLRKFQ